MILSAWVGWYVYRAEQQRAAVQWVQENGGTVVYGMANQDVWAPNDQPPSQKWLYMLFGVDYLECVNQVRLVDSQVTDITPLASLTNLKKLQIGTDPQSLEISQISDLTPLASLTKLERLSIFEIPASDLRPLAGLTNLKDLRLWTHHASDLTPLADLTKLESLFLLNSQASDLTPLAGLTSLKQLIVISPQVSDLTPFSGLAKLEELSLRFSPVSQVEIVKLQKALPNCQISIVRDHRQ